MAYGKNENDLALVSAFRRAEAELAKPTPRLNTKSRIPAFTQEYQLSTTNRDTVRLIAGDYPHDTVSLQPDAAGNPVPTIRTIKMPFIQFTKHYDGLLKRGAICSAGPFRDRELRKPCHGCDIYFATAARNQEGRFESSRMSKQPMYAFSLWDYGVYHNAPQLDSHGAVKMSPQNKPYMQWTKCIVQGCPGCRAGNLETKQGIMRAWTLNSTQYKVLTQTDKQVGASCAACLGVNCIRSVSWITSCCRNVVIDMQTTQLTMEEINKQTTSEHTCQQCRTQGLLIEQYACGYCAQRGQQGVRASLFDVDLQVMAVAGTNNAKILQVTGFGQPNVIPEEWKPTLKPLDLPAIYAPDSLDFQAKMFHVQPTTAAPQPQQPLQPQGMPQQAPPGAMMPQQPYYPPQAGPPPQVAGFAPTPPQQPQYAPPPQQYAPQPQYMPQAAPPQQYGTPVQQPQYAPPPQYGQPEAAPAPGYGPPAGAPLATPYGPRR